MAILRLMAGRWWKFQKWSWRTVSVLEKEFVRVRGEFSPRVGAQGGEQRQERVRKSVLFIDQV